MITFQIVPRRGIYKVEAIEPNGDYSLRGMWHTGEAAVSQLKDLQAKADREICKPALGEPGWRPRRLAQA